MTEQEFDDLINLLSLRFPYFKVNTDMLKDIVLKSGFNKEQVAAIVMLAGPVSTSILLEQEIKSP